jgi:hypothetical protein
MNLQNPKVQIILAIVDDSVGKLLYYDRKGDEDLPVGVIEEIVRKGDLSHQEIVECFSRALAKGLGP